MFEGMSEKYIRIPERNRIFDSIKRRIRQGEKGGREKLERIRESRRNSFQEISNRRSATPTCLFLAIPQDILPFPSHFVQFLSNFLPSIHFLAYSRVYERNFFVNCRDKQKKKKEKINQFSRNWLIKITREEKKSRYKAYTDERRKLETLSLSLSLLERNVEERRAWKKNRIFSFLGSEKENSRGTRLMDAGSLMAGWNENITRHGQDRERRGRRVGGSEREGERGRRDAKL